MFSSRPLQVRGTMVQTQGSRDPGSRVGQGDMGPAGGGVTVAGAGPGQGPESRFRTTLTGAPWVWQCGDGRPEFIPQATHHRQTGH